MKTTICGLLMDAVFGPANFVANIVFQKKYAPAYDKNISQAIYGL